MATLFQTDRPTLNSTAVREAAMREFMPRVAGWLSQNGETNPDLESLRKQLDDVLDGYSDGYEAATDLERHHYWSPDGELVDILDGYQGCLVIAEYAAVSEWVKENKVVPKIAVGEVVTVRWGRETITGPIVDIHADTAQYVIGAPGYGPKCGPLIKFEDVEDQP